MSLSPLTLDSPVVRGDNLSNRYCPKVSNLCLTKKITNDRISRYRTLDMTIHYRAPERSDEAPSLLDSIAFIGHDPTRQHPCGPKGMWAAKVFGGTMFPLNCNRITCPRCITHLVKERQIVIANSEPDHWMTLTMPETMPDEEVWQVIRVRYKRFANILKKRYGYVFSTSRVVEPNPKGTGFHMHLLVKGGIMDFDKVRKAAVTCGFGEWFRYEQLKWDGVQTMAGYGLKGFKIAGYGLKENLTENAARARLLNGGWLEHHDRDFLTIKGRHVKLPEATKAVRDMLYNKSDDEPIMLFKDSLLPFAVMDNGVKWDPIDWAIANTDMNSDDIYKWYTRFDKSAQTGYNEKCDYRHDKVGTE